MGQYFTQQISIQLTKNAHFLMEMKEIELLLKRHQLPSIFLNGVLKKDWKGVLEKLIKVKIFDFDLKKIFQIVSPQEIEMLEESYSQLSNLSEDTKKKVSPNSPIFLFILGSEEYFEENRDFRY